MEDNVQLALARGSYELAVFRGESSCVRSYRNTDIIDVLGALTQYHRDCVENFNLGGNVRYSEEDPNPRLFPWNLVVKCDIPDNQKGLLRNIVMMHNSFTEVRTLLDHSRDIASNEARAAAHLV